MRHEQGQRMTMVRNALAVADGQASETPIEYASGQIQPLRMTGIDFATVWTAKAGRAANANH